jgi:hypothetical protein
MQQPAKADKYLKIKRLLRRGACTEPRLIGEVLLAMTEKLLFGHESQSIFIIKQEFLHR